MRNVARSSVDLQPGKAQRRLHAAADHDVDVGGQAAQQIVERAVHRLVGDALVAIQDQDERPRYELLDVDDEQPNQELHLGRESIAAS